MDDERLQVGVVDLLLLVREQLEVGDDLFELGFVAAVAELHQPLLQGVAAGVLPQHDGVGRHSHGLRRNDLVSDGILQNAVLVNARLVREGRLEAVPMGYLLCGPVGVGR